MFEETTRSRVGAGIIRQQILWDTSHVLHHHDFLVTDSPWCSRRNMKIWAISHISELRCAKYIAKIGSAEECKIVFKMLL